MKQVYSSYYHDDVEVYGGDGGSTVVTQPNGANLTSGDCFKLAWALVRSGFVSLPYYRDMGMTLKWGSMGRREQATHVR